MSAFEFAEVARLPAPGDNVGIATRRLEAGTRVGTTEGEITLSHTLMEGHRFAVAPIPRGRELLSWGLPFGAATRDIDPGDYVCNAGMLEALGGRRLDFALPAAANFEDRITPYVLDEAAFEPAPPLPLNPDPPTFRGFDRGPAGRGRATTSSSWEPARAPPPMRACWPGAWRTRRPPMASTVSWRWPTPRGAAPGPPTTGTCCCAPWPASPCTPTWGPCSPWTTAPRRCPTGCWPDTCAARACPSTRCPIGSSPWRAGSTTLSTRGNGWPAAGPRACRGSGGSSFRRRGCGWPCSAADPTPSPASPAIPWRPGRLAS